MRGAFLELCACAALAGCSTIAGADLTASKATLGIEAAFDAAVVSADAVVDSGVLTPAQVAKVKSYVDEGHADVGKLQADIAAGDAVAEALDGAVVTAAIAQITGAAQTPAPATGATP